MTLVQYFKDGLLPETAINRLGVLDIRFESFGSVDDEADKSENTGRQLKENCNPFDF
jgi:hypothetical protein